jgi:serine/threonine protein kinase
MNKDAYNALCKELLGKILLDKYVVDEGVGFGSYGIVLKCTEILGGRTVAIKLLSVEERPYLKEKNYINEIMQMAKCYHCINVLQFITAEKRENTFYLVTEYASGGNLRDLIKQHRVFEIRQALNIAEQILNGLQSAHSHNIIHRDIKPENILISEGVMKISDFGVAKAIEKSSSNSWTHIGTPAYMAPEQFAGQGSYATNADLYSVGIILYEMVSGEKPKENFKERMRGKPLIVPKELPKGLQRIIGKATKADPKRRYQTAEEMRVDIYRFKLDNGLIEANDLPGDFKPTDFFRFELAETRLRPHLGLAFILALSRRAPRLARGIYKFFYESASGALTHEIGPKSAEPANAMNASPIELRGTIRLGILAAFIAALLVTLLFFAIIYFSQTP